MFNINNNSKLKRIAHKGARARSTLLAALIFFVDTGVTVGWQLRQLCIFSPPQTTLTQPAGGAMTMIQHLHADVLLCCR